MLQLSELRVGNFFGFQPFFTEKDKIKKVTRIKKDKVFIDGKWLNFSHLNLVEITEDILLHCGFTQFQWLKDASVFQCEFFKCKLDSNGLNFFSDNLKNLKPVKYLHKLQNLYFDLTGEELEINLNDVNLIKA